MAQEPLVGQGRLIAEISQSYSDTPLSEGILWRSDQSDAETSTWQHTTILRNRQPFSGGIRTRNPSKRTIEDPRLRERGN
jgi:hypothetical protein